MEMVLKEGAKVWKQGERKDGSESLDKLDAALSHEIDRGMAKAEATAERDVEEAAIRGHEAHPRQLAKDEAKLIMRGVKSSEALVGDDLSMFRDGMKGAEAVAKEKGGGQEPGLGKKTEDALNTQFGMMKEGKRIQRAMETYVPGTTLSLLQLKPDAEVIKNSRQDAKSRGHPKMAAKYAAMVEGAAPAPAAGTEAPVAPAASQQPPSKPKPAKTSSEGGHYSPKAPKKVDPSKYVEEVMNRVGPTVDMQFAPLEERLGYNLHEEVRLAKHEAAAERARSASETKVTEKQRDFREATAIEVAAKDAEEEAQVMKAAVNKAKKEHSQMGPAEEALSLLQLGEGTSKVLPPPSNAGVKNLRSVVQKKAIKMMVRNNHIDQVMMKAMRKAEATFNTEIAPEMPRGMAAKPGATDILDRQLKAPSAEVSKEEKFMANLQPDPTAQPSFPISLLQVEEAPSSQPPADFNPLQDVTPAGFKVPSIPLGNAQKDVANAVPRAMASQQLFEQLRQAAIRRVEKDDHDAFAGLKLKGMTHAYKAETKLQNHLESEATTIENKRITAARNVANGVLPNGQKVHMSKYVHLEALPKP
jgi:hypothetical protein